MLSIRCYIANYTKGLSNMCNIAHVKLTKISKFLLKTTIIY